MKRKEIFIFEFFKRLFLIYNTITKKSKKYTVNNLNRHLLLNFFVIKKMKFFKLKFFIFVLNIGKIIN
jgi:hypothetical protein